MFEVEIKVLIENYQDTKNKLQGLNYKFKDKEIQKNHYFNYDNYSLGYLFNNLRKHLNNNQELELSNVIGKGNNFSIRTRKINNEDVYFIIKYSIVDENSSNGNIRKELELLINLNLDELDTILLNSGLNYSSKWSREREIYINKDITATIDLNAGYGYLLELESLTNDIEETFVIKNKLQNELNNLNLKELNNDLLNYMFKYYENNWNKYYGTNNYLWDDLNFYKYVIKQIF